MTNPYFERPASVAAGTTIRSDKYNSDLDTQESAFNALHDKLQHAVFLPETFSGNPNIPEQTVNDTFIYIDTSGNIALYPIATILEQFELVEQRYNQIDSWQQQVAEDALEAQDSATLSQRYANEADNVEIESNLYSARHWANHAEAQIPLIQVAGQEKVDLAQGYASANKNVEVETGFYSAKHYSLVAADQIPLVEAAGQAKVDAAQVKVDAAQQAVTDAQAEVSLASSHASTATTQANSASASASDADNFANYAHNQTIPSSGGKYSAYHWAKESENYAQQTLNAVNGDFVPNSRTVNGKTLDANIILNAADVSALSSATTIADLNGVPSSRQVNGKPLTGNITLNASDVNALSSSTTLTTLGGVPTTRTVNGKALDTNISLTAANVGALPTSTTIGDLSGVPTTRTVNGKALSTNITLNSSDVGALSSSTTLSTLGGVPTSRTINGKSLNTNITLNASDVSALPSTTTLSTLGGVPTSRQVNGKALTSNITLTSSDVGALPNSQKGRHISRISGSFTATRNAGVTEYVVTSTTNATCTINDSAFSGNDKLIIHKQYQSGQLNITSGNLMYLPDGSSASSHHIPAGNVCTVELVFTGSNSELRIYN